MITFVCLLVLPVLQVVTSQGPPGFPGPPPGFNLPEKCKKPPSVKNPQQCCQTTPIVTEEEFQSCGFEKFDENNPRPPPPPDCSKHECILKSRGFFNDGKIDYEGISAHLDKWSGLNDGFQSTIEMAKTTCLVEGGPPGPPHMCEAGRMMSCVGAILFFNCPDTIWSQTDDCTALKSHMTDCKPPFLP